MSILHVNTATGGGAAIAALRLHAGMVEAGMNSSMLTLTGSHKTIPNHQVYKGPVLIHKPVYPTLTLKNWVSERLFKGYEKEKKAYDEKQAFQKKITTPEKRDGYNGFELFSLPHSPYDITQTEAYKQADIIHLHWVEGFLDYPSFFAKNKKPVVWTLHDECAYLGGFHYEGDLRRNEETHGAVNEEILEIKERAIQNTSSQLVVVSPSDWIAEKARISSVFRGYHVKRIRYWLSRALFKPHDKNISRKLLNIPLGKQVFLLSAANLNTYRKGMDQILSILEMPELSDSLFVFVGSGLPELAKPNVLAFGNVTDERLLPLLYSAADAFVLPSREDNLPNTMLESIACETPVFAFDIGDNKDFIRDQGVVVKNPEALGTALVNFQQFRFDFRSCRPDFDPDFVLSEYQDIYDSLK